MKGLLVFAVLWGAATSFAAADPLTAARRALGDELWSIAARSAAEAADATTNAAVRASARLVELEALAREGRAADMLARLGAWTDAAGDGFRYWRAWAELACGRTDHARNALATPFESPRYAALALRLSARAAAEANDRAAALSLFAKAAAALASDPVAHAENAVEWAQALDRFGDAAAARAVLERERAMEVAGPAGDAARLLAADLLARTGEAPEGRRLLEWLVAGGTNTAERAYVLASCALADAAFAAGATNESVRLASNAVRRARHPDLVRRAGFTLGFALLADPAARARGYAEISALVRRFPDAPESGRAQLRLADGLLAAGDAAAAAREYETLLQAYPEHTLDAHVLEGRGRAFTSLSRHVEAAGLFARAAQVATNAVVRARCLFERAEALMEDARFEEAATAYGAVPAGALQPQARLRRAEALLRAQHADEAVSLFRALAGGTDGIAVEAALCLAALHASRGHFEQAISDYGALLGAEGGRVPTAEQRVRALSGRGRALYRAYRFREAKADFAAVAELRPDRRDEMGFLSALCLYGAGRDQEAYDAARALLATVADSPLKCDLQFWLAKYEAGRRAWTAAIAGFETCATNAHATATRRLEALVRAARCATALPDFPKVVELAGRVVSKAAADTSAKATDETPYVAEALVLQGEALKELARFDEAILVFERAGRMPVSDALRYRAEVSRADCLFAMGANDTKCYRAALESYRALLRGEKLTPSARLGLSFKIARTYEKLRRFDEAAETYYTHVVLAYWNGVRPDAGDDAARRVWFDGTARAFFARAAFSLADYYEARGESRQAARVLDYLVAARVPSADEAKRRIQRLKEKGGFR